MNDTVQWVDTHCHVYDERTPGGADASIANATAHDVTKVIVIGTDANTTRQALAIASRHDNVWATVGLHPHDAKLGVDTVLPFVDGLTAAQLAAQKIVAIGECGLDFITTTPTAPCNELRSPNKSPSPNNSI